MMVGNPDVTKDLYGNWRHFNEDGYMRGWLLDQGYFRRGRRYGSPDELTDNSDCNPLIYMVI